MRDRIIYRETYKAGTCVRKDCLPITKHTKTYQPRRMDLKAAGVIEVNGEEMEFQDVRLYFPRDTSSDEDVKR